MTAQKGGPPVLGPAQPLTTAFVEDLAESLSGGAVAEFLPENILAKTDRMVAWWTPRCVRRMFFENAEGKAQQLNGRTSDGLHRVWMACRKNSIRVQRTSGWEVTFFPLWLSRPRVLPSPASRILRRTPGGSDLCR